MSHANPQSFDALVSLAVNLSFQVWALLLFTTFIVVSVAFYTVLLIVAPIPRLPLASEKTFITVNSNGEITKPAQLPCWHDKHVVQKALCHSKHSVRDDYELEPAEIYISVVVPAFNEEQRLGVMLDDAVDFLNRTYMKQVAPQTSSNIKHRKQASKVNGTADVSFKGWEILIVSDGSTDQTEKVALEFAKSHPGGSLRVITLKHNRGKGGAVIHGMRHVRGEYVVFADADGASSFKDVEKLIEACNKSQDGQGRAVAVGSRAYMVGSESVVKRSVLRNFLMHSFHVLLRLLTPPATARIEDTQCGFKLFTRNTLPHIVPNMHSEGWIFDVEMLMLAEKANIPMIEVPVGWKEVKGSKLNVVWDSLGMAWGLAVLRAAWTLGVYKI